MAITRPNLVWSTDSTYIRLTHGFVFLVAIMDWYSRYVLAWQLSDTLERPGMDCAPTSSFTITNGLIKRYSITLQARCIMIPHDYSGLHDPDYRIRLRNLERCREQHELAAAPWIHPLLGDRESLVRSAAIVTLGELRDQEAFDLLIGCLQAATTHERRNTVQALVALRNPQMRVPLILQLETEPRFLVRIAIIQALSTFRADEETIDALIRRLTDHDEDVRATAAVALAKMGASKAIDALDQMARTDTNHETLMKGLATCNSTVARQAMEILLAKAPVSAMVWPG